MHDADPTDDAALKEKETALVDLGKLYRDQKCVAFALEALPASDTTG